MAEQLPPFTTRCSSSPNKGSRAPPPLAAGLGSAGGRLCLLTLPHAWPARTGLAGQPSPQPCVQRRRLAATRSPRAAKARPGAASQGRFGWAFLVAFPRHRYKVGSLPEMQGVKLQPVPPLHSRAPPLWRH